MAKVVTRTGRFNMPLLSEEIRTVAPELIETQPDGSRRTLFFLEYDGTTLTGTFPDDFDLQKLQSVAAAHDPDGESINQRESRRRQELRQGIIDKFLGLGFTVEELKYIKDALT